MARNAAAAACCSAAVLLLAVSVYAAGDTKGPRTAVQAPDLAAGIEETGTLLPVHRDTERELEKKDIKAGTRGASTGDVASLATADEEGKGDGSDWGESKKLDDNKEDSDSDSDDDSGSDSDSDSDSDLESDSDSDSDSDDEEDHSSKKGSKKHPAPWRKEELREVSTMTSRLKW